MGRFVRIRYNFGFGIFKIASIFFLFEFEG